jgi:hypothetical protein
MNRLLLRLRLALNKFVLLYRQACNTALVTGYLKGLGGAGLHGAFTCAQLRTPHGHRPTLRNFRLLRRGARRVVKSRDG